jgi:hypothetical protein
VIRGDEVDWEKKINKEKKILIKKKLQKFVG